MSSDGDDKNAGGATAPTANPEQIAAALRSAVQKQFKLDGNVIPSAMRIRVEKELGLAEGFFKSDPHWKAECKAIITGEFEALTEAADAEEALSLKKKPVRKPVAKKPAVKPSIKRVVPKKAKTDEPAGDEDAAIGQEDEDEAPKKSAARRGKAAPKKASPTKVTLKKATSRRRAKPTIEEDEEADAEEAAPAPAPMPEAAPGDDSELSELEDELPKNPTKRARATSGASPRVPTPKRSKAKPAAREGSDADEAASLLPAAAVAVDSDSELSDVDEPPKKKPGKRSLGTGAKTPSPKKKAKVSVKASPEDEGGAEAEEPKAHGGRPSAPVADDGGSDSDMSIVLDPTPHKGRSSTAKRAPASKTKSPKTPAGRKAKAKKADSKESVPLDREQEQLKSLKAWLLKCGIRKVWSRELAKFDTPHAQITHLKSLLAEVGMAGRPSVEKAKKIKEERELRAEVEAVQLGAGEWGREGEDNAGKRKVSTRSMRTAPAAEAVEKKEIRGMEEFAFLDDQSDSD